MGPSLADQRSSPQVCGWELEPQRAGRFWVQDRLQGLALGSALFPPQQVVMQIHVDCMQIPWLPAPSMRPPWWR